MSINYNGTTYYYVTNLQGDVVAILNSSGTAVVSYTYDAWGKPLTTTGTMANTLGLHNPLRYRGYVYDRETGLYYLQSRYYNPEWGRFINADNYPTTGQGLTGNNMFVYCLTAINCTFPDRGIHGEQLHLADISTEMEGSTTNFSLSNQLPSLRSPSFSFANHVNRKHVTTTTEMLDLGALWGKIGFSTTVTDQDQEPGLFYSYTDLGINANKFGVGVNINGWLGLSVGVSDELHIFASMQVTPWLHGEVSIGLDGIGVSFGFDVDNIAYDFEVRLGVGAFAYIFISSMAGYILPSGAFA